tara:strand:- start:358622 stop:359284 length:663 start_codon:yes stop_codon:yes gene_type:complete
MAPFAVKADYTPMKLYKMILGADKIVYGEIIEIDSLTYKLKIEGDLTGEDKIIKVFKFTDWPCAWRWTDYEIGQKQFLFLKKYKGEIEKHKIKYYAMSAGNEGELPVLDNFVFINGKSLKSLPANYPDSIKQLYAKEGRRLISNNHSIYSSEFFGHKVAVKEFIVTCKTIRRCFQIELGKFHIIEKVTIKCDAEELKKMCCTDQILNWTFKELNIKSTSN